MPKYEIRGADGSKYQLEAVDDKEAMRLETFINERLAAGDKDPSNWNPENAIVTMPSQAQKLKQAQDRTGGKAGFQTQMMQGVSFGLSDEAAGVANMIANPLTNGSYEAGRDAERMRIDDARNANGWTGTGAELIGGFAGGLPRAGVGALMNAGQAARRGMLGGVALGGIAGFGSGEGAVGSGISALVGAGLGGVLGGGAPIVANMVANRIGGVSRLLGNNTDDLSRQIVGESIRADTNTAAGVGQRLTDAGQRGVPLAIADTGDNARGLLASVSRQPGPARTLAREAIGQRQVEQGDRVVGAIGRDLGPIANMRQQSDNLITEARTAASPLYDAAYANPVISTPELDAILATPAGRGAVSRARTIAANERRNPEEMGFVLDADGNVSVQPTLHINEDGSISQVPTEQMGFTTQTLDYVKRGLDDTVEAYRDPVTQRLSLDDAGRGVNTVRGQLVSEIDRLNPDYAAARAAYAGPASAEEALQLGRQSLSASAEDIEAAVGRMTPAQRQQYALGFRTAMADNLGRAVDGADKVGRLIGTPRKRAALASLFGGEDNFARFLQTMTDERATNETYRSVMTGSQTAERLAADAQTGDMGLIEAASGTALRGVTQPVGLLGDALKALRDVGRFGAGEAGNRTRESVAALLTETDPAVLEELARTIKRATVRQQAAKRGINRNSARLGGGLGNTGSLLGSQIFGTNKLFNETQ